MDKPIPEAVLLPCPMCGSDAALNTCRTTESEFIRLNGRDTGYGVNCVTCGLNNRGFAYGYATPAEAITAWNRRALTAAQQQGQAAPPDALVTGAMEAAADACPHHGVCSRAIAAAVEYVLAQQPTQQQGSGEVVQRHVVTKYRDGSVHVADITAPPSAPVVELAALREFFAAFKADNATGESRRRLQTARERVDALAQQPAADRETEFATIAAGADCPACGEPGPCGCKGHGQQPAAGSVDDTRRMDWLEQQVVEVRRPMRYGSIALFHAEQVSDDDEPYRTDLRAQIDSVLATQPQGTNHD